MSDLGLDNTLLNTLIFLEREGKPLGDSLTISYIQKFYLLGLSFSEIGVIKGISEDGIRYNIKTLYDKKEWAQIKYIHSNSRKDLKNKIMYLDLKPLVDNKGLAVIGDKLGYSVSYFERFWTELESKYGVIFIEG